MVRIDSKYFDIVVYEYDDGFPETFECDDYIAPVISLLNKKKYFTENCCEGHVAPSYYDTKRFGDSRYFEVKTINGIYYSGAYIMMDNSVDKLPIENFPFKEWKIEFNDIYQSSTGKDTLLKSVIGTANSKKEFRKIYKKINEKGIKYKIVIRQTKDEISDYIDSISGRNVNHDDMYNIIDIRNKDIRKLYDWVKNMENNEL